MYMYVCVDTCKSADLLVDMCLSMMCAHIGWVLATESVHVYMLSLFNYRLYYHCCAAQLLYMYIASTDVVL